MAATKQNSRFPSVAGLALAATGLSHFAKPELFESITAPAFPNNTRKFIFINGGIETALGLALLRPETRKLAGLGGLAYAVYLGANAARNQA
ncbi:membrane protein [soil metagenome]